MELRGSEIQKYSGDGINKASNVVRAIIISLIPTIVVLVLYFVKKMIVRVGLVIILPAVCSFAFAIFMTDRKVEIFLAIAA